MFLKKLININNLILKNNVLILKRINLSSNHGGGGSSSPISMAFNSNDLEMGISKGTTPTAAGAEPMIVMHGLFGSKLNWKGMNKALNRKFLPNRKIFAVDARNHGESPHTVEHSYELLADDIAYFMNEQKIEKCCAMGHSMGGRAMMYFALKYPQMVDSAIIIDISPINMPRDFMQISNIFKALRNINIPNDLPLSKGRKIVEIELKKIIPDQATIDFIMQNLKKTESNGFRWSVNLESLEKNFDSNISNFPSDILSEKQYYGPVLFIGGSKSSLINPSDWPLIQKIFPNSTLSWLDCGHLVHFEKPAEFMKLVVDFVNK